MFGTFLECWRAFPSSLSSSCLNLSILTFSSFCAYSYPYRCWSYRSIIDKGCVISMYRHILWCTTHLIKNGLVFLNVLLSITISFFLKSRQHIVRLIIWVTNSTFIHSLIIWRIIFNKIITISALRERFVKRLSLCNSAKLTNSSLPRSMNFNQVIMRLSLNPVVFRCSL